MPLQDSGHFYMNFALENHYVVELWVWDTVQGDVFKLQWCVQLMEKEKCTRSDISWPCKIRGSPLIHFLFFALLLVPRNCCFWWILQPGSAWPRLTIAATYPRNHSPSTQLSAVGIWRGRERQPGRGWRRNMQTTDWHGKQHEISAIREIQVRSTMKWAIKSVLAKVALVLNLEKFVEFQSH